jgi:hypothetical protein
MISSFLIADEKEEKNIKKMVAKYALELYFSCHVALGL